MTTFTGSSGRRAGATLRSWALSGLTLAALTLAQAGALVQDTSNGQIDWAAGTITVKGTGAPRPGTAGAQARLLARRAAVADAYRNMAEIIRGVHVTAETTVENFVATNDTIKTSVDALIKGASPVGDPSYLSDGSVEITMTAPLTGVGGLSEAVIPALQHDAPVPAPSVVADPAAGGIKYTGLVIDARAVKVTPALAPTVRDETGARVYDAGIVLPEMLARKGAAIYVVQDNGTRGNSYLNDRQVRIASLPGAGDYDLLLAFDFSSLWTTIKQGFKLLDTVTQVVNRVGDNPVVAQLIPRPENTNLVDMIIPKDVNNGIQQARGLFDFLEQASVAIVGSP